ncbi:MAG: hypothetical protein AAF958_16385 [Planctomycetota bacterium]
MSATDAPAKPCTLLVMCCDGSARQFEVSPGTGMFLGHSTRCGVQLFGKDLPDIVCRVEFEDGQFWVQNWMSNDLVSINGKLVSDREQMKSTDLLEIPDYRIRWMMGTPDAKQVASGRENPAPPPPPATVGRNPAAMRIPGTHKPIMADPEACEADLDRLENASFDGGPATPSATETKPSDSADAAGDNVETVSENADAVSENVDTEAIQNDETLDNQLAGDDWFNLDDDDDDSSATPESYDHETVALLQAEIEELRAALRDAATRSSAQVAAESKADADADDDAARKRIEQLVDEANRSDERVAMLEEMLLAAEQANRSEREERSQIESWMGDIEKRLSSREDEQRAEVESLQRRLRKATEGRDKFISKIRAVAQGGHVDAETIERSFAEMERRAEALEEKIAEGEKERARLQQQVEESKAGVEIALREERAKLAQEQAKVARMRYEISNQISQVETLPKTENSEDKELALKMRTLREHLREIHEQEKQEIRHTPSLSSRLSKLWRRTEY